MKQWIGVILLVPLAAACSLTVSSEKKQQEIAERVSAGALIVDVRTPEEFAGGHFQGALNIPVDELGARLEELGSHRQSVVLYCRSGGRAGRARTLLIEAGFQDVLNAGGLDDLQSMVARVR